MQARTQARTVAIRYSTWLSGFLVGVVIAFSAAPDARAEGPTVTAGEPAAALAVRA